MSPVAFSGDGDEASGSPAVFWTLTREVRGRGTFGRLEVVVDDERVAQLAIGESVQLVLPPGPHRLRVRTGFSSSDERTIDGKNGERYEARFSLPRLWGAVAARTPWPTKAWTIDVYRLHPSVRADTD